MSSLRDAVIDEVRWPRMFQTLRRAGLYRDCGCAGCGSCQAAARRFVLGVARSAAAGRSPRRPWRIGQHKLRGHSLGERRFDVVVANTGTPTIVDIVESEPLSFEATPHQRRAKPDAAWIGAIRQRKRWPLAPDEFARLLDVPARVPLPGYATAAWKGLATFRRLVPDPLRQVPNDSGLYLIVWPNGAYLGKSVRNYAKRTGGIHGRVEEHRRCYEQFHFTGATDEQRREFVVIWLCLKGADEKVVNLIELNYRQEISGLQEGDRSSAFADRGFRNRSELEQ